jgi:fatty acid desaturase
MATIAPWIVPRGTRYSVACSEAIRVVGRTHGGPHRPVLWRPLVSHAVGKLPQFRASRDAIVNVMKPLKQDHNAGVSCAGAERHEMPARRDAPSGKHLHKDEPIPDGHVEAAAGISNSRPSAAAVGHIPVIAPAQSELSKLTTKSNWRNWPYLAEDWIVIAVAILLSQYAGLDSLLGVIGYVAALVLIGSRMRGLMNLVHQGSHGVLFANERLNKWATRLLAAWPLAVSLQAYKNDHDSHHTHLGDAESDPKVLTYEKRGLLQPVAGRLAFVRDHVVKPIMLRWAVANVVGALRGKGERAMRVLTLGVALGIAFALGRSLIFVEYWIVPFLTTFQIIRYWGEGAEHSGLDQSDPFTATRSWTAALPVRWLIAPHTDHFHLVHHLQARIPHYNMAEAHRILMHGIQAYAAAHHCDGFLFAHRPDTPSVMQDMRHPERFGRFETVARPPYSIQELCPTELPASSTQTMTALVGAAGADLSPLDDPAIEEAFLESFAAKRRASLEAYARDKECRNE